MRRLAHPWAAAADDEYGGVGRKHRGDGAAWATPGSRRRVGPAGP